MVLQSGQNWKKYFFVNAGMASEFCTRSCFLCRQTSIVGKTACVFAATNGSIFLSVEPLLGFLIVRSIVRNIANL